jgi:hypothetical protein
MEIDPMNKISTDTVPKIVSRLNFVENWTEEELKPGWYF